MFKKPQTIRIAFIFLLMAVWPVISGHAIALNEDQKPFPSKENNSDSFVLMAQNQSGSTSNMSLGEIVSLNTKEDGQDAIVSIETNQPVQYTAFKLLNPLRLVLDFPKMNQGNLTSRIQVDKGIVNSIRPIHFKESDVLRLEIVLNQPADYEIQKQNNNKLIAHLQSSKQESGQQLAMSLETASSGKAGDKNNTSMEEKEEKDSCSQMLYGKKEKISLDFQNVDVRNAFSIFEDISGYNFVLSPEVGGSVNIRMADVPWNKAMEIILSNGSMGRECFGKNIIRIATKAVLVAEESGRLAEKARAANERSNELIAQDLVTEVVRIDNADITELSTSLAALKSARTDAQITVDTRTNTLILNDLRKHVDDMLETIYILDIPTPQVLIEAKIVEMTNTAAKELGIQWGFAGDLFPGTVGAATLAKSADANTSTNSNFLVDLTQTTGGSGFDLFLGNLIPGVKLNAVLDALETMDKTRVLASPRVVVADNKEARIQSGSQIPYVVTSAEGDSVQFVDAELSLTVTPHVTFENRVYMVIDATKNGEGDTITVTNANANNSILPVITTNEAHTEVLVGNGDTTVLGGVFTSKVEENKKAVPFLSKIPILGYLFKSFADSKNVSELMVFITPTIIETN
jgi:type IV pilus assembly protein PilQ